MQGALHSLRHTKRVKQLCITDKITQSHDKTEELTPPSIPYSPTDSNQITKLASVYIHPYLRGQKFIARYNYHQGRQKYAWHVLCKTPLGHLNQTHTYYSWLWKITDFAHPWGCMPYSWPVSGVTGVAAELFAPNKGAQGIYWYHLLDRPLWKWSQHCPILNNIGIVLIFWRCRGAKRVSLRGYINA